MHVLGPQSGLSRSCGSRSQHGISKKKNSLDKKHKLDCQYLNELLLLEVVFQVPHLQYRNSNADAQRQDTK